MHTRFERKHYVTFVTYLHLLFARS